MTTTEKTYTDKQSAFLEALLSEARGDIRTAMDIAGYARTTKTAEVVSSLKEEITERASMMMAMNAPKAAFGIVEVLNDPSSLGAKNAISAAREALNRSDLIKKEQIEVTNTGGGMFILPPKRAKMWQNKTRPNKTAKIPYAYTPSEDDPLVLIPDPEIVRWVEDALDSLDQGHRSRQVAAWLVEKTDQKISHQGIISIWEAQRGKGSVKPFKRIKQLAKKRRQTALKTKAYSN